MNRNIAGLMIALGFAACQSPVPERAGERQLPEEEVVPEATGTRKLSHPEADGLFDDFIYRFAQDSTLQYERIVFPLEYRKDGEALRLDREDWKYDSVYSAESEYTYIYDGKEVKEKLCDTTVRKATLEVVDLRAERVRLLHFFREGIHWRLKMLEEHDIASDSRHAFFAFYSKFVSDVKYQQEHVHDPFYFTTFDNDSFQEIEGWVSADLWSDYRIDFPREQVINSVYDDERPVTPYRTFVIGSPSSGVNCTVLFKCTSGRWELVRLEN